MRVEIIRRALFFDQNVFFFTSQLIFLCLFSVSPYSIYNKNVKYSMFICAWTNDAAAGVACYMAI